MNKDELKALPTLFDILEEKEYLEQLEVSRTENLHYSIRHNSGYIPVSTKKSGYIKMMPCSPRFSVFYRGQNIYKDPCRPSLFREDMDAAKVFQERLKLSELEILLEKYYISQVFNSEVKISVIGGGILQAKIDIDVMGIAQHYGIKTEYLDITPDLWTAAFFAATYYNKTDKQYHPVTDESTPGVFYELDGSSFIRNEDSNLQILGLQPLERPTRQSAIMLKLERDQDFNSVPFVKKTLFRHDKEVNLFIYRYMNHSLFLFPKELIEDKIDKIVESNVFSYHARKMTINRFYKKDDDTTIARYENAQNIKYQDEAIVSFTDHESQMLAKRWEELSQSYSSMVHPPIPFFRDSSI